MSQASALDEPGTGERRAKARITQDGASAVSWPRRPRSTRPATSPTRAALPNRPGVSGHTAHRRRVVVVDLAGQRSPPPRAVARSAAHARPAGTGPNRAASSTPREHTGRQHVQRLAGDALDRASEDDEAEIAVDGRACAADVRAVQRRAGRDHRVSAAMSARRAAGARAARWRASAGRARGRRSGRAAATPAPSQPPARRVTGVEPRRAGLRAVPSASTLVSEARS